MNKILYFSADWCGPCKEMKPVIDQIDPSIITKYNTDFDEAESAKYGIRAVPTFVIVDEYGHEIDRMLGIVPIESLLEAVK